jgi:hypothetical protein
MNVKASHIVWVLFIAYTSIGVLLYFGMKEPKVIVNDEKVVFSGMYGDEIFFSKIKSIMLTEQIPELKYRSNGLSAGSVKRGYYKTKQKERIKLLIFTNKPPFLMIEKRTGIKVYYNSKKLDVDSVYNRINEKINLK